MSHDTTLATKVARAELAKRVLIVLIAIVVSVSLILVVILQTQNRRLLAEVEDCTNPDGQCAQRGQEQTGKAVGSINENTNTISLYAAACADRPGDQTLAQIKRCVDDLITAAKP